jgi:hypothetical protein
MSDEDDKKRDARWLKIAVWLYVVFEAIAFIPLILWKLKK